MGRLSGLFVLALLWSSFASAAVRKVMDGSIVVEVEDTFEVVPRDGFAPVWVRLQNRGHGRARVELSVQSLARQGMRVERVVELDGGESRIASLPVPGTAGLTTLLVQTPLRDATEQIRITVADHPNLTIGSMETGQMVAPGQALAVLEPQQAPTEPAALIGYGSVIVSSPISALDASALLALESYALLGGSLIFVGEATSPPPQFEGWRWSGVDASSDLLGFGHVHVCGLPNDCASFVPLQKTAPLVRAVSRERTYEWTGEELGAFGTASETLLPNVGRPPILVFLVLIIGFAIAIGPVNLRFAQRRGRYLLLLTTPLLAVATCGGIAAWGAASDGLFTVHAASRGITYLDHERHRAATLLVSGYYAAMSPGEVRYPPRFAPMVPDGSGVVFDWADSSLGGSAIPSRSHREFAVAGVEPTRARLVWTGSRVENGLGGRIVQGWINEGGTRYALADLPQGAAAEAREQKSEEGAAGEVETPFEGRFTEALIAAQTRPPEDGEFLAILEGAPFLAPVGLERELHHSIHLVRGRWAR